MDDDRGRGWGNKPKPAVYDEGMRLARKLSAEALIISQQAWYFEMLCRDVRLASTSIEKLRAVQKLEEALNDMDEPDPVTVAKKVEA